MFALRALPTLGLLIAGEIASAAVALREPVHPRRNVEAFAPVEARFIRFTVRATNRGEPCIDELEIYAPESERNLALAAHGARASASGSLAGYQIHDLSGINDGRYGNGRSWIADRIEGAWVQIELPDPTRIARIVWGRDREGRFIDRLSTDYEIALALDTNAWQIVASSGDRQPLGVGAQLSGVPSLTRPFVNRFAPVSTTLPPETDGPTSDYRIDVWQTADGLPGNTVTAIEQTADGYLWIGTLNGLARFDGMRFQIYREAAGLPNSRVLCLRAARDGALWIGTDGGGLVVMRHGTFHVLTRREGLCNDSVLALAEDAAGGIWAGTAAGLSRWHKGTFHSPATPGSDQTLQVPSLLCDGTDALWLVSSTRLLVRTNDDLLRRPPGEDPSSFSSVFTVSAGQAANTIWYGGANGYVGVISNASIQIFREQPGQLLDGIWALCETRRGDLWVGTAGGGLRRLRDGKFTSLTTQEGLSDNSVRSLLEDREGNLWVGTVGGGLNRVKPRRLTTVTTRDGLAHNVVMSLAEDRDGTLWVGSNCGGLSARRQGVFAPYYANYLLDNECIWSLLPTRDGALWIGTWGGGLFRMRGQEVQNFSIARTGDDDPVIALCEDGAEGLWLGTMQGGLKRFRQDHVVEEMPPQGLPPSPVTALVQEPGGALWIGTSGAGVLRYADGHFTALSRSNGLPSDFVRTLYRDARGTLWIGTRDGLGRLAGGQLSAFTRAHGLPDEVISQILEDDQGNLWFGCNQGIFRVARHDFETVAAGNAASVNAIAYGRDEGLENLECTGGFHPAGLRTRDGKLWFSTVKGLVTVDPANLPVNQRPPPVLIEHVLADGLGVPEATHQPGRGPVEFAAGVRRLEFQFSALSLVAPERNRFRYRLEGLEKDWVEAGSQRAAAYAHLPPGRYEFRVSACNNDGVWNERGASLAFLVQPAFWQTWWFRVLGLTALLGAGGWVMRVTSLQRLRRKLRRLEERHALEKERTRIAQDIHDELGANLTRIALLTEVGRNHRDKPEEVAVDLGKISATAREALRAMDAIVWAVNPRNDTLDHFANYVSQFAEEFFRPTSIRCRLDVPPDLPEHALPTETRHHLFLAVKEALNNVVRHSGASEVWLRLRMENAELTVTIADDGRGITPAPPGTGGHHGLGNIRRRLEALGGRFELVSHPSSGTILRLHLHLAGSAQNPLP